MVNSSASLPPTEQGRVAKLPETKRGTEIPLQRRLLTSFLVFKTEEDIEQTMTDLKKEMYDLKVQVQGAHDGQSIEDLLGENARTELFLHYLRRKFDADRPRSI